MEIVWRKWPEESVCRAIAELKPTCLFCPDKAVECATLPGVEARACANPRCRGLAISFVTGMAEKGS